MTPGALGRLGALALAYFSVSVLERAAAAAAADAAASRAAAHAADEALFAHLTGGECACPEPAAEPAGEESC